jgi:hypothetical protein
MSSAVTDPLASLRAHLARQVERLERPFVADLQIDDELASLRKSLRAVGSATVPRDLQREAVKRFWTSLRFEAFRDARLVSFGLTLPPDPGVPPLIEDTKRFLAVLSGLERFVSDPRRFRRCYQGLAASYFAYDGQAPATVESGKTNWLRLRDYLGEHASKLTDDSPVTPSWVEGIHANPELFNDSPCASYAAEVLAGDPTRVDQLRQEFAISDASWFLRELVLAQIAHGASCADDAFIRLLPRLLRLLGDNNVVRDRGATQLLDRYARCASTPVHRELRDQTIAWWGNPWVPSNRMRWGSVAPQAREMVAEWLKLEFLEAFFTLLAEDGFADQRRLTFWKRYVHVIDHVQFALGAEARSSRSTDMAQLRRKMQGLVVELTDPNGASNAFIMEIGNWVLVEFSGKANALYCYDRRRGLPFDTARAVISAKRGHNSLKSDHRILWMKHGDNLHGYDRWEQMFAATLKEQLGVEPVHETVRTRRPAGHATTRQFPFSDSALVEAAKKWGVVIEDRRRSGGALWVKAAGRPEVERILKPWGFQFKAGKGWWK